MVLTITDNTDSSSSVDDILTSFDIDNGKPPSVE